MSKHNDGGGPAFPTVVRFDEGGPTTIIHPGMTLRDYFAAQAMQAIVSSFRERNEERGLSISSFDRTGAIDNNHITGQNDGANEIAEDAYAIADAMLAARKEQA